MLLVVHFSDEALFLVRSVIHHTNGFVVRLQQTVTSLDFVAFSLFFLGLVVLGLGVFYFVFVFEFRIGLQNSNSKYNERLRLASIVPESIRI